MNRTVEQLETRDYMAPLLGVRVELLDTAGAPVESVEVGEEFVAVLSVKDNRWRPHGVRGVWVDVEFDSDLLEVTGFAVSDKLPSFRRGAITPGRIQNMGGFAMRPLPALSVEAQDAYGPAYRSVWEEFGRVGFRAIADGEAEIETALGRSGFGLVGFTARTWRKPTQFDLGTDRVRIGVDRLFKMEMTYAA